MPAHTGLPQQAGDSPAETRSPVRWRFVVVYALAHVGLWMALLAPLLMGLALRLRALDPVHAKVSLAWVTGVGALLATLSNPLFGYFSDRTVSRFGMRRPWLLFGAVAGAAGLMVIALATSVLGVLVGWCIAQVAYNAMLAVLSAMLPDQVPTRQRGTVAGVLGVCTPLGMVAGTYVMQATTDSPVAMFMLPAAAAVAGALALAATLDDRRLSVAQRPRSYRLAEFLGTFWIGPLRSRDFAWAWASRFLLFVSIATLLSYQPFYLIEHLGLAAGDVPHVIFVSTLVQSIAVVVFGIGSGRLSDARGERKRFVFGAAVVYALAMLTIAFADSTWHFLVGVALAGIAQAVYVAIGVALVADVLPDRDAAAAKDLGVFNIASALPQSLAPALAAVVLSAGGGYTLLFIGAALFAALSALAIRPVGGVR
ncbi:MAG: MFS transporter [Rudaea sp.]